MHIRAAGRKPPLSNKKAAVHLQFAKARGLLKQFFVFKGNFVLAHRLFLSVKHCGSLSIFLCCIWTSVASYE